jgi:hypothetical protein
MVKVIVAKSKIDCENLLGKFVDESYYDVVVNEDTDCYLPADCSSMERLDCTTNDCANCSCKNTQDERKIAFKFRKNFFTAQEQEDAYAGLRDAATKSQNRGLAAGPKGDTSNTKRDWVSDFQLTVLEYLSEISSTVVNIDLDEEINRIRSSQSKNNSARGLAWLKEDIKRDEFVFEDWLDNIVKEKDVTVVASQARTILKKYISGTTYANTVDSGIAGWYDRYTRTPYGRATAYTEHHLEKFKKAYPFLQSLNRGFKELLPWRWSNQKAAADKIDQRYLVPDTVFTTITVNKTFRTACHRDAGDLSSGLSNLLVLSNNGKFTGGYLVFPEYRIAVNVRPGDLLLVNNHEIIHANTPIECEEGSERISLVCYFREGMLDLKSKEYEDARYNFIEERRKNKEHPIWHPHWNGISPDMFKSEEWRQYLINHNMEDEDGVIDVKTVDMFA